MTIAEVADLLACPVCRGELATDGAALGCPNGHRFDIARQGHVNLLGRAAPRHADTAAMVQARIDFLGRGHYRAIDEALIEAVGLSEPGPVVVEAGAGPGLHLAAVVAATGGRGLATDISAYACRRAARLPHVGAVVADTWAGLPVRGGVADIVLAVFAPRNPPEFARVLRPGGRLVVVTPAPDHLASLRADLGLLAVEDDKLTRLDATVGELALVDRVAVRRHLTLAPDAVRDLVLMGPNAFHETGDRAWRAASTELAVDVSVYARP